MDVDVTGAPRLLLLPPIGLGEGSWQWLRLRTSLRSCDAFEGLTKWSAESLPGDLAGMADCIAERYGRGPYDVVGSSLGGMLAQHLALRHPGLVRSLVLVTTTPFNPPDVMRQRAAAAEGGMAAVVEDTLARWFPGVSSARMADTAVRYARRELLAVDAPLFAAGWRAMATHDLRPQLGEISVPVTCVAGARDPAVPVAVLAGIADRVADGRLEVLDCGHLPQLEVPLELSDVIDSHLDRVSGAACP